MVIQFAGQNPAVNEILIAGIRPLPINRMMRQAGRKANDFYTKGRYIETNVPHPTRKGYQLELRRPGEMSLSEKGEGRASQTRINRETGQNLADETLERLIRAQDAINNWDPIEASAIEDMNRLRGGRRGPTLPDAAGFVMDLETIPTPSNPDGVRLFGGV